MMRPRLLLGLLVTPLAGVAQVPPSIPWNGDSPPAPATIRPSVVYTLDRLPAALVASAAQLFAPANLATLALGSGATMAAHGLDESARRALRDRVEGMDDLGDLLGDRYLFTGAIATAFVTGQLAPPGRWRRASFDLAQAFLLNTVGTNVLKRSVRRERPDSSNTLSFPSGHTSTFASAATVMARHFGAPVAVPAVLTASFVAVSRVMDHEHFLSDVVAGAVVGFIVGRTVTRSVGGVGASGDFVVTPTSVAGRPGVHVQLTF